MRVEPWQQVYETCFSGTRFSKQRDPLAGGARKAHIFQNTSIFMITKAYVFESYASRKSPALAAVPGSMREGSYACGASKFQTIWRIVLPRAAPIVEAMVCLVLADHWLRQRAVDALGG